MIKNIIAIYPGRFQPFGKHHAAAFKWLQQQFGQANAYIVTSDKVDPPKSPFDFNEKKAIISQYGFTNIVQVKNPYKAEELMNDLNPSDTAVVFMVGEKDMQEDPRFKIGQKKDGSPSYFQVYKDNKSNLQGFDKHGYLVTAPHISIAIPGYGEMSGTELRNVLGTKTVSRDEKKKIFKDVFGWYDEQTANMIFDKLEPLTESIFTKNWWARVFESINTESVLTEETIYDKIKTKAKDIIKKVKQENNETKLAFLKLLKAAKGDLTLSDSDKLEIGNQMKDVLKMLGLATIAIVPGGSIAAVLIKLFKQEHLITPSAFMAEASLKPNIWSDFNLASLSKEDMDIVWQMYSDTYAKAGLDFSANDASELQTKYKAVYLKDIDNDTIADAFIIYKPTAFGNKISLLGTNNKKEAKKSMLAQLFKLLKTRGWFIEASMKMEDILSAKSDIPAITNEKIIQAMVGAKGIEIVKNGYYKRKLSKVDKTIVKRLYGTPKTDSIQEGNIVPGYTITPGGLEEGKQVGPLYHYTSADGLKGILSSNRINASEEYYLGNNLYYISFTRNKNFHNKGYKFGVKTEYRITLDGNKLSNRYKIIPFAYKPGWNYEDNWEYDWLEDEPENVVRDFFNNTGDYDEQEERISFKSPKDGIDNIKNYILAVYKVEDLQEVNLDNIYQTALTQTEKEALELVDKNWNEFGGEECNNGFCDIFAKNLKKHLPGSKIMSTEDPRNNTLGHVWVEYKGKYFDAETPNGVDSWKQLPWMIEFYSKNNSYPTDIENLNEIGDASAKSYPFTSDTDPSKLVDTAKKFHETNTSHTYYQTKLTYKFKTNKANYIVNFTVSMERKRYINFTGAPNFKPGPPYDTYVEVGFNIDGESEERNTNLNEQFSVLSTVTKIIFDFIDKLNKAGGNLTILYIGAKNDTDATSKLDSKRGKLYAAYLKKNLAKLPNYDTREHTNSDGSEYIQIYKKGTTNEVSTNIKTFATKQVEENLELATPSTLQSIANKHRISINHIKNQLQQGLRIEKERTKNVTDAIRIALQRIFKDPDYYVKLKILSLEDIESTVILPTVIEAIINNMVVCNGCGWTWKLSDGGKDPYLCHKCRTDNTPKFTSKSLDTNYISEVGEANLKPYKWEEVDRESYSIYIRFITDSETQYNVDVTTDTYQGIPILNIEFTAKPKGAEGSSSRIVVNKGEMYKVMATIVDIIKKYLKKSKAKGITYYPSKKSSEDFGTQRDMLYKAFISKAIPGVKFEPISSGLYGDGIVALLPDAVTEGYMGVEQTKKHNAKLDKLKNFLNTNIGREFVYDFDMYPKTVVGVGVQESAKFIPSSLGKKLISDGGAAGHMAHPFNIDWVKNGKDLLEVFKMAVEYLKNGPGAVKIDGLNASIRLIELDGKKQFVLDRGSQKDLDIRGITKADLLDRFGNGHGMITIGGKVLDIFNDALNATSTDLKQLGLWNDPNLMFNLEYVSGTSNVIEYGNNFLAIHGLLEITRQPNAKTGKPGARVSKEVVYNEDVMQNYIDKLAVFAQKQGYEVVGSVPTELTSDPNFTKVLSEKVAINYGNGKTETKPLSQWLSTIKVPETQTIKLTNGKTVNALSKAVLNAVLEGIPLNEFVADVKDIPLAIDGAITYIATAKLGDEVLKNLDSKLGSVADHEGVVIRDERIYNKPFKLTGQFIITGQTSQFQK